MTTMARKSLINYVADDKLRTIVVYAPKDVVAQVRKVVEQLDQPGSEAAIGRNIDMTLSFLRCSTKTPAQPATLPADLESVARQLRSVTQYIRLPSMLPTDFKDVSDFKGVSIGTIKIHPESVTRKDQGRSVRFSTLRIGVRVPYVSGSAGGGSYQYNYADVGLTTSGDFVEGQKTVLGKVSGVDDETSIFVVISLKVLD